MFGMGASEIIVILVVALIFLGPEKLPETAAKISKGIRDIRKQTRELTSTIENDTEIGGAIRDIKSALRGDEPRPKPKLQSVPPKKPAAEIPAVPPPVKLPASAGEPAPAPAPVAEPAPEAPAVAASEEAAAEAPAEEGDDLASLVRPAAGTVRKGGGEPS